MRRLDGRSLSVGVLAGVLVMLAVAAAELRPEAGYQISAWSAGEDHGAFLVNTRTGEVTSIVGQAGDPGRIDRARRFTGVYSIVPVREPNGGERTAR